MFSMWRNCLTRFSCEGRDKVFLYLFAGQGTQEKGMFNNLMQIKEAREEIEIFSHKLELNFPEITTSDENNLLNKTSVTQPLLVLHQCLSFKYLYDGFLKKTDYMMGHSIGEYSALTIAGSIGLEECLRLVKRRGELMEECSQGERMGMLTVRFNDENKSKVWKVVEDEKLEIACFNTPNNVNVAGSYERLQAARNKFKEQKITCIFLPVSAAFHCSFLKPILEEYGRELNKINFLEPKAQIIRNLDAKVYQKDNDIKEGLKEHLVNAVQFEKGVRKIEAGVELVEVGGKEGKGVVSKYVEETRKKMMNEKVG